MTTGTSSSVASWKKGIASSSQNADKAQFHLKLGRVLETKFLAGVKALKHFQDAYKLNPALIESLESARSVYWGLGKLNMVQKLLELELKAGPDGKRASALLVELGDVLCDQGDWEKAAATYARALKVFGERNLVGMVSVMGQHTGEEVMLAAFDQQLPEGQAPLCCVRH